MDWKQYQEKIAEIFVSLGATSETNVTIEGARGIHNIDVIAKFTQFGQDVIWICECKYWKTPIPKEKVLTLYQITQDIGADRGLLFSESGFQAGAIKATNNTNITLTSISEIKEMTESEIHEKFIIASVEKISRIKSATRKLWLDDQFKPIFYDNFSEAVLLEGQLMYMSLAIQKALSKEFPIVFSSISGNNIRSENSKQLVYNLQKEVQVIEKKFEEISN